MSHYISRDSVVLEIGRELWVLRAEPPNYSHMKFRGPFRSNAEASAWISNTTSPEQTHAEQVDKSRLELASW